MPAPNKWARFSSDIEAALNHHRAGRIDRATAIYHRVLDKSPDHPDALHMLGVIATSRGRPDYAIQLIERAMSVLADAPDAHLNLGNAHHVAGRSQEAISCYRRALALNPNYAIAHSSLARELNQLKAFADALPHCQRAIALEPRMPEAWLHAGSALRGLGNLKDAGAAFHHALSLRPDLPEALEQLALIAVEESRFPDAVELQQRLITLKPNNRTAIRLLALFLFRAGRADESLDHFKHLLAGEPDYAQGWTSLGWVHRALGHFPEAIACFEKALSIDPDYAEARRSLAATGQQQANEQEIAHLRNALADEERVEGDRVSAGFAVGTLLDSADRYDEAFACFEAANWLHHQTLQQTGRSYDPRQMTSRVDGLITTYDRPALGALSAAASETNRPIFIVGMPRSGTTLVEQILASHSQIFGAGELTEIAEIARRLSAPPEHPPQRDEWSANARREALQYLRRLDNLNTTAFHVTDKQPDNVLHLGLIHALFPRAPVVLVARDPRDICLSNYFQLFAGGNPWSYDLIDCAHRYRETAQLVEHWQQVLPMPPYTIRYEALVADLEGEIRLLLDWLSLPWDPACLNFHATERTVITQSTWQVRQRIYTKSVGRWRSYEAHIQPLLDALGT